MRTAHTQEPDGAALDLENVAPLATIKPLFRFSGLRMMSRLGEADPKYFPRSPVLKQFMRISWC